MIQGYVLFIQGVLFFSYMFCRDTSITESAEMLLKKEEMNYINSVNTVTPRIAF